MISAMVRTHPRASVWIAATVIAELVLALLALFQ